MDIIVLVYGYLDGIGLGYDDVYGMVLILDSLVLDCIRIWDRISMGSISVG